MPTLQAQLYDAAYSAFIDSFLGTNPPDGDMRQQIAAAFAQTFSQKAATAIDAYIKSATIMGGMVNTVGGMTAQAGPITVPPTIT